MHFIGLQKTWGWDSWFIIPLCTCWPGIPGFLLADDRCMYLTYTAGYFRPFLHYKPYATCLASLGYHCRQPWCRSTARHFKLGRLLIVSTSRAECTVLLPNFSSDDPQKHENDRNFPAFNYHKGQDWKRTGLCPSLALNNGTPISWATWQALSWMNELCHQKRSLQKQKGLCYYIGICGQIPALSSQTLYLMELSLGLGTNLKNISTFPCFYGVHLKSMKKIDPY